MEEILRLQGYEPIWDEWHVDQLICEGNLSSVYQVNNGTKTAVIKVISVPKLQADGKNVSQFSMENQEAMSGFFSEVVDVLEAEIERVSILNNIPNILNYQKYEAFQRKEDVGYDLILLMEKKQNLKDYMKEQEHITNEQIVSIVKEVAVILEYAHQEGIIHKDLKIENIFIDEKGHSMLADFTLARKIEGFQSRSHRKLDGTYMAPEILSEYDYTVETDIYALGVILYLLLNDMQTPKELSNRTFKTELARPVRAGERLAEVVFQAIAYRPKERFASVDEFFQALNHLTEKDFELPSEYVAEKDAQKQRQEELKRLEDNKKQEEERLKQEKEERARKEEIEKAEAERRRQEQEAQQKEIERKEQEKRELEEKEERERLKQEEERNRKLEQERKEAEEKERERQKRQQEEMERQIQQKKQEEDIKQKEIEEEKKQQAKVKLEEQKELLRKKAEEERRRIAEEKANEEKIDADHIPQKEELSLLEEETLSGSAKELQTAITRLEEAEKEAKKEVKEKLVDADGKPIYDREQEPVKNFTDYSGDFNAEKLDEVFEDVLKMKNEEKQKEAPSEEMAQNVLLKSMLGEVDGEPEIKIRASKNEYSGFFDFDSEMYKPKTENKTVEYDKSIDEEPYEQKMAFFPEERKRKKGIFVIIILFLIVGTAITCFQNKNVKKMFNNAYEQILSFYDKQITSMELKEMDK